MKPESYYKELAELTVNNIIAYPSDDLEDGIYRYDIDKTVAVKDLNLNIEGKIEKEIKSEDPQDGTSYYPAKGTIFCNVTDEGSKEIYSFNLKLK